MKKWICLLLALLTLTSCAQAAGTALDAMKGLWLSEDQYYYNQLSVTHKSAWEKVISNALFYPNQTPSPSRDVRCQALASMIKMDNPRIFWIDWIDSNARLRFETGNQATYAQLKLPDGMTMPQLKRQFTEGVDAAVKAIEKKLPANATVRQKATAIQDWLCKNNTYNKAQTSSHKKEHDPVAFAYLAAHSAYSAIIPGDAYEPVCEGYAGAFKILCDELGVKCLCVAGSAKFASQHVWNYIQTDSGKWYLVDVTSNDAGKSAVQTYFMLNKSQASRYKYTPFPYLFSGVTPENGYKEGAKFTFPELTK